MKDEKPTPSKPPSESSYLSAIVDAEAGPDISMKPLGSTLTCSTTATGREVRRWVKRSLVQTTSDASRMVRALRVRGIAPRSDSEAATRTLKGTNRAKGGPSPSSTSPHQGCHFAVPSVRRTLADEPLHLVRSACPTVPKKSGKLLLVANHICVNLDLRFCCWCSLFVTIHFL